MNRLLQIIVAAIAAIAGYKQAIASLREQLATANSDRESLRGQVAKDAENDTALTRRAEQAEADKAALEQQIAQADAKASELAQQLNEEPSVPSVHTDSFEVTAPPSEPLSDLAFRENQAELAGRPTSNPAPAVSSGDSTPANQVPEQENK